MDTITFTRGVPANESFPLEEVASAAVDALKAAWACDAAVRSIGRLRTAA